MSNLVRTPVKLRCALTSCTDQSRHAKLVARTERSPIVRVPSGSARRASFKLFAAPWRSSTSAGTTARMILLSPCTDSCSLLCTVEKDGQAKFVIVSSKLTSMRRLTKSITSSGRDLRCLPTATSTKPARQCVGSMLMYTCQVQQLVVASDMDCAHYFVTHPVIALN